MPQPTNPTDFTNLITSSGTLSGALNRHRPFFNYAIISSILTPLTHGEQSEQENLTAIEKSGT